MNESTWNPGPIGPKPVERTIPVSVRMPEPLYDELRRYAETLRTPRSYLIVECVRRLLAHRGSRAAGQRGPRRRPAKRRKA